MPFTRRVGLGAIELEYMRQVLFRNAPARVFKGERQGVVPPGAMDRHRRAVVTVAESVVQQVEHDLVQFLPVGGDRGRPEGPCHVTVMFLAAILPLGG